MEVEVEAVGDVAGVGVSIPSGMRTNVRVVELTPSQKGAAAEAEIMAAAVRMKLGVLLPLGEGYRYDLVLEAGGRLLRVQCKWATLQRGAVQVRLRTCRHTPHGYFRTTYTASEVDAIAIYCTDLDRCFLVPIEDVEGQTQLSLRVSPTGNNQASGVKWASSYDFGAIAQLGER
jgi:PD-(D/E)XK endonuclease